MKQRKTLLLFLICFVLVGCTTTRDSGRYISSSYLIEDAYGKAKKLYDQKHYEQAKEAFRQYLDENPDDALYDIGLYYLGECYKNTKDYGNAKSTYQKLIDKKDADAFWVDLAKKNIEEINSLKD